MKNKMITMLLLTFIVIGTNAQSKLTRIWYNQEKTSKVRVFLATDGKYYGKIVWLEEPTDKNGKPKTDIENPNAERRSKPLMDLQILAGLEKKSETEYVNGTIYDPKNGKTYGCKMTIKDDGTVDLRGHIIGMPLLGRTSKWTQAE